MAPFSLFRVADARRRGAPAAPGWSGLLRALAAVLLTLGVLATGAVAEAHEAGGRVTRPRGIGPRPPEPTGVVINLPARTLYWYWDGVLVRSFPVGVGKPPTPTIVGSFRVENKAVHPWWLPPSGGEPVPPGPQNPLGTRWIGFRGGYGIHGNNNPASIGHLVSLGCVRMYLDDVEWLYEQVAVGTPVTVQYEPVQIQVGTDGREYLAVYPDVYGRGHPSPADVLKAAGYSPDAVEVTGPGLYRLDAEGFVNGSDIRMALHRGQPYVLARDLAVRMGAAVTWDPESRRVSLDGQPLPTVLLGGRGYVDAGAAAAVLGVEYSWNPDTATAVLTGRPLFLGGHLLARSGLTVAGEPHLPVRLVAEAAGHRVDWVAETRTVLVDGRPIPYNLVGSTAYTRAAVLAERLRLRVTVEGDRIYLEP